MADNSDNPTTPWPMSVLVEHPVTGESVFWPLEWACPKCGGRSGRNLVKSCCGVPTRLALIKMAWPCLDDHEHDTIEAARECVANRLQEIGRAK